MLYWAGDTILCDEVRAVIQRHRPEVIVVHGCGARWEGIGPLVMDGAMVLETMRLSGNANVVVMHMDSVDHATVSRDGLRHAVRSNPDARHRLHIHADGEVLSFNRMPRLTPEA